MCSERGLASRAARLAAVLTRESRSSSADDSDQEEGEVVVKHHVSTLASPLGALRAELSDCEATLFARDAEIRELREKKKLASNFVGNADVDAWKAALERRRTELGTHIRRQRQHASELHAKLKSHDTPTPSVSSRAWQLRASALQEDLERKIQRVTSLRECERQLEAEFQTQLRDSGVVMHSLHSDVLTLRQLAQARLAMQDISLTRSTVSHCSISSPKISVRGSSVMETADELTSVRPLRIGRDDNEVGIPRHTMSRAKTAFPGFFTGAPRETSPTRSHVVLPLSSEQKAHEPRQHISVRGASRARSRSISVPLAQSSPVPDMFRASRDQSANWAAPCAALSYTSPCASRRQVSLCASRGHLSPCTTTRVTSPFSTTRRASPFGARGLSPSASRRQISPIAGTRSVTPCAVSPNGGFRSTPGVVLAPRVSLLRSSTPSRRDVTPTKCISSHRPITTLAPPGSGLHLEWGQDKEMRTTLTVRSLPLDPPVVDATVGRGLRDGRGPWSAGHDARAQRTGSPRMDANRRDASVRSLVRDVKSTKTDFMRDSSVQRAHPLRENRDSSPGMQASVSANGSRCSSIR